MRKTFSKDSEERMMLADFYNMCQKFWIAEKSNEYWKELIKDTDEFTSKYKNQPLAVEIAVSLLCVKEKEL